VGWITDATVPTSEILSGRRGGVGEKGEDYNNNNMAANHICLIKGEQLSHYDRYAVDCDLEKCITDFIIIRIKLVTSLLKSRKHRPKAINTCREQFGKFSRLTNCF
jgi:hypothetical protein